MARILIAWESGGDLGHVGQLLPLAKRLRKAGHDVFLALKHLPETASLLDREGFAYFMAPPVWERSSAECAGAYVTGTVILETYADILANTGWTDVATLATAIKAWRSIFTVAAPDLLVCHAAATAQLAAWGSSLRVVRLGTGFDCPPLGTPLAPLRYWQTCDGHAISVREHVLMDHVGKALQAANSNFVTGKQFQLADVLRGRKDFLCTLPELDHYPCRQSAPGHLQLTAAAPRYFGPLLTLDQGLEPAWPACDGVRLLAYLRPPFAAAGDLLQAMRRGPWRTLLVVPGLSPREARALITPHLTVVTEPVRLGAALAQCDAVISHGGHGMVAASLLAGKPVLNLPNHLEQLLVSRHAVRIGAGSMLSAERKGQDVSGAVDTLVGDPRLTAAAQRFAASYAGATGMDSFQTVTRCLEEELA